MKNIFEELLEEVKKDLTESIGLVRYLTREPIAEVIARNRLSEKEAIDFAEKYNAENPRNEIVRIIVYTSYDGRNLKSRDITFPSPLGLGRKTT